MNDSLVLYYISNIDEKYYPVKDVEHACKLTDAIAQSDLMNNDIEFNTFDLIYKETEEGWFTEDFDSFEEYYSEWLDNQNKM